MGFVATEEHRCTDNRDNFKQQRKGFFASCSHFLKLAFRTGNGKVRRKKIFDQPMVFVNNVSLEVSVVGANLRWGKKSIIYTE